MALLRRKSGTKDTPVIDPCGPTVPIAQAQARVPVRVVGHVTRMRARPRTGLPALVVTIADDTGSAVLVWTGRRSLGGLTLGRRVVVEGVAVLRGAHLEFTNPTYTLLA